MKKILCLIVLFVFLPVGAVPAEIAPKVKQESQETVPDKWSTVIVPKKTGNNITVPGYKRIVIATDGTIWGGATEKVQKPEGEVLQATVARWSNTQWVPQGSHLEIKSLDTIEPLSNGSIALIADVDYRTQSKRSVENKLEDIDAIIDKELKALPPSERTRSKKWELILKHSKDLDNQIAAQKIPVYYFDKANRRWENLGSFDHDRDYFKDETGLQLATGGTKNNLWFFGGGRTYQWDGSGFRKRSSQPLHALDVGNDDVVWGIRDLGIAQNRELVKWGKGASSWEVVYAPPIGSHDREYYVFDNVAALNDKNVYGLFILDPTVPEKKVEDLGLSSHIARWNAFREKWDKVADVDNVQEGKANIYVSDDGKVWIVQDGSRGIDIRYTHIEPVRQ